MRIWGLGLGVSGTCVPLSGRSRPPKNPATGNWESEPGKTFRDSRRDIFHYLGHSRPRNCEQNFCTDSLVLYIAKIERSNWATFEGQLKMNPLFFFIAFKKLFSCSPVFSNVQGPFAFVTSKISVASRTVLCLLRGWCCFRLGNRAFGLGILNMFCHYMLSSGGLVGRFYPMVQLASAIHLAAGGSLSRLRFERLWTCSFQLRSKVPPQDKQLWPPKRGSKSKAQNQAAFIGLHCAVPARGRWIATDGRPTQAMRQFQSTGM